MTEEEANAVRNAVIAHLSHGRLEQGTLLLDEYANHLPEPHRLECLGTIHFYRRDFQEAVRCYEEAIALAPTRVIARYQYLVGNQDEREGRMVEAFKRYQAAIEADRTFLDAYVDLGALLVKVGDLDGAANCYKDAVQLDPLDTASHHNLVTVLKRLAQENKQYEASLLAAKVAYETLLGGADAEGR